MNVKIEELKKEVSDLQEKLKTLNEENGNEKGKVNMKAEEKESFEKRILEIETLMTAKDTESKKKALQDAEDEEKEKGLKLNHWLLKAKYGEINRDILKTVMSEGDNAQGGYVVPTGYADMILGILNDTATVIAKCTTFPQKEMTVNLPKYLTDLTVAWVDEAAVKGQSKPTLTRKQSILKKLAVIVTMTDELLADNNVNIDQKVAALVAENFAVELERVILAGNTGAGDPFMGALYDVGVNVQAQIGANLAYVDLLSTYNYAIIEGYRKNPEWYLTRSALTLIMNMVDTTGRPLWNMATPVGDKLVGTILGSPYNISSQIPVNLGGGTDTAILFGDWKNVYVGEKSGSSGIAVKISQEGIISTGTEVTENLFTQDETAYRFVKRNSVVFANPEAFVRLTGVK